MVPGISLAATGATSNRAAVVTSPKIRLLFIETSWTFKDGSRHTALCEFITYFLIFVNEL